MIEKYSINDEHHIIAIISLIEMYSHCLVKVITFTRYIKPIDSLVY